MFHGGVRSTLAVKNACARVDRVCMQVYIIIETCTMVVETCQVASLHTVRKRRRAEYRVLVYVMFIPCSVPVATASSQTQLYSMHERGEVLLEQPSKQVHFNNPPP